MNDIMTVRLLGEKQPNGASSHIWDRTVEENFHIQKILNWLWLIANKHQKHSEICRPTNFDLIWMRDFLKVNPDHIGHQYIGELERQLDRYKEDLVTLLCNIEKCRESYERETIEAFSRIIEPSEN